MCRHSPPTVQKLKQNVWDTSAALLCQWYHLEAETVHEGPGSAAVASNPCLYTLVLNCMERSSVNYDVSPRFYGIKTKQGKHAGPVHPYRQNRDFPQGHCWKGSEKQIKWEKCWSGRLATVANAVKGWRECHSHTHCACIRLVPPVLTNQQ